MVISQVLLELTARLTAGLQRGRRVDGRRAGLGRLGLLARLVVSGWRSGPLFGLVFLGRGGLEQTLEGLDQALLLRFLLLAAQ